MSTPMVAPVRRPPHDPTSLLLDARAGWILGPGDGVTADGELRLARDPASRRRLTEASGSFGGLRLPANAASGPDGTLWLLDAGTATLMRFDPCRCAFVPVRALRHGGAIAAGHARLFACDTAGGRLDVLALPGAGLSERWRPAEPWRPLAVLVDRHHQVRVLDDAGRLHAFSWTGRHLGQVGGLGAGRFLAQDLHGRIYVAGDSSGGPATAYRVDGDTVVDVEDDAAALPGPWAPVPPVGPDGVLELGAACVPPAAGARFDPAGRRLDPPAAPAPPAPAHLRTGTAILGPLDSRIDTCTWHRVVLTGTLPAGCAVEVTAVTAHTVLPAEQVGNLPPAAWGTPALADHLTGWDCLVTADPGRYLWLRLGLTGTGAATPGLSAVQVEFPRITLRRYLPAVYGVEPASAAFTDRFLALFDRVLRDVEARVDDLPAVLDADATPFLDWLSSWVGLTVDPALPEATRRRLLARSARLYDLRGTHAGLRELLSVALGVDRPVCPPHPPSARTPRLVLEHFRLRRWLRVDAGRIGSEAQLWGRGIVNRSRLGGGARVGATQLTTSRDPLRDPFHVHAHRFTVFVPAAAGRTPAHRRIIRRLVEFGSPAHTAGTVEFVEPRMRLGVQSCLGLDSVVARVPTGLVVGGTPLGSATLPAGPPSAPTPPQLGTTSVLH